MYIDLYGQSARILHESLSGCRRLKCTLIGSQRNFHGPRPILDAPVAKRPPLRQCASSRTCPQRSAVLAQDGPAATLRPIGIRRSCLASQGCDPLAPHRRVRDPATVPAKRASALTRFAYGLPLLWLRLSGLTRLHPALI